MTPLTNNIVNTQKRELSEEEVYSERETKRLKNNDGEKVSRSTPYQKAIDILAELKPTSPAANDDAMDIDEQLPDQTQNNTLKIERLNRAVQNLGQFLLQTSAENTSSSDPAVHFIECVKYKKYGLRSLINSLISDDLIGYVLTSIPWDDLDDDQKNNLFSCFFSILDTDSKSNLKITLESLIPISAHEHIPILPLKPSEEVYKGLNNHFPGILKHYSQLVFNYSSKHKFLLPVDTLPNIVPPNVPLPHRYSFFLESELPLFFKTLLKNGNLPNDFSTESFFVSFFSNYFKIKNININQLVSDTASNCFKELSEASLPRFDLFYKCAGPILLSATEISRLLTLSLPSFWNNYVVLLPAEQEEGLLISRNDLSSIEYFNFKVHFEKNEKNLLTINECFDATDYLTFFQLILFKSLSNISIERLFLLLNLLHLTDYPNLKEKLENRLIQEIPNFDVDAETLLNLFSYTDCSLKVRQALVGYFWENIQSMNLTKEKLPSFKKYVDFLPTSESKLLLLPDWILQVLGDSIKTASFYNDQFQSFKYLKNLENVTLHHCSLSQSFFTAFQIPTLKSVEINGWKGPLDQPQAPLLWETVKIIAHPTNYSHFGIEVNRFPNDLLKALKNVKNLEINFLNESGLNITSICSNFKHLQTLEYCKLNFKDFRSFSELYKDLQKLPKLKSLSVSSMTPYIFKKESDHQPISTLESLSLSLPITPDTLNLFPNLTSLELFTSLGSTFNSYIREIENLKDLETLVVTDPHRTNPPLNQLLAFAPNVIHIHPNPTPTILVRQDATLSPLPAFHTLKKLKKIHLSFFQKIDKEILLSLGNLDSLIDIHIRSSPSFCKKTYSTLIQKPNLKSLSFYRPENLYELEKIYAYALEKDVAFNVLNPPKKT